MKGYDVQTTLSAGQSYQALFQRCTTNGSPFLAIRDESFLRWRFQHHPYLRAEIVEVWIGKDLEGYVIFTKSANVIEVLDHLAATPYAASALQQEIVEAGRNDESVLAIDACSSSASVGASPWSGPLFLDRGSAQAVMYVSSSPMESQALPEAWHFTRADKDV